MRCHERSNLYVRIGRAIAHRLPPAALAHTPREGGRTRPGRGIIGTIHLSSEEGFLRDLKMRTIVRAIPQSTQQQHNRRCPVVHGKLQGMDASGLAAPPAGAAALRLSA